jgi:hypothetical protein
LAIVSGGASVVAVPAPATPELRPLARHTFGAAEVVAAYPPRLVHPHKKLLYRLACPADRPHAGTVTVTRWAAVSPLAQLDELCRAARAHAPTAPLTQLVAAESFFRYEPEPAGGCELRWHLNFADERLFAYYGGPLLAQDELQVAEHPALASLRHAMDASDVPHLAPLASEGGRRTPVLIRGVERRCRIATDVNEAAGRPHGLYGHRFARADAAAVERAVVPLVPPTLTNLIAMEAPSYGRGSYTRAQIEDALSNACTGFLAARAETRAAGATDAVVHTGFWGCGAFGGNRTLMTLVQLAAAQRAGLARLVFHTADRTGTADFERALALHDATAAAADLEGVAEQLFDRGFRWGEPDGN